MRPSIPRFITIVPRTDVPKSHLQCIKPPPAQRSARRTTPTLIDYLRELQKERNRAYMEARRKQKAGGVGGDGETDAKEWPKNLRVEPIVKREAFSQISRDVRMRVKDALKER